jgi:predicted DNA-binding WGR domain protein
MKKWVILINQDGNHNKFWAYEVEDILRNYKRYTGRIRFGRIGAVGQEYVADAYYVESKEYEKLSKGYEESTP